MKCTTKERKEGGGEMATYLKRFSITVSDEMAFHLDRMKKEKYYNTSQNKMIQDLICLGLEVMEKELGFTNDEGTSGYPKAGP